MSWRQFFRRAHWDRDRAEELRSYLEIETDENIARGMSPEAARRAAHIKLGNTVRIREEIYRMNTISPLDTLGRDLRMALRGMRRRPGFTLAVVLTLALGIGANTAIFGVVDGVLIKPLPYPDADELVSVEHVAPGLNVDQLRMSASQYFTYREEGRVFQHIGLYGDGGRTITGIGEPEQARALFVTYDVLQALRVQPQLGRLFTEADATPTRPGVAPVVILTHAYWQRRFGGDRSVIGRRLIADSNPAEVVGVMPEGFRFLDMEPAAEVISLITFDRNRLTLDGFNFWSLARLKPGVTVAEANADIARMLPIWLNAWPISPNIAGRQVFENWRITPAVQPLKDEVVGGVGDMLWILMATIGMVLLIACANVANLMLVRSESRRQEFAVRTALGAGRGHIAREVLVESLVLSLIGGALGIALRVCRPPGGRRDSADHAAARRGHLPRSACHGVCRCSLIALEHVVRCASRLEACRAAWRAARWRRARREREPRAAADAQFAGRRTGRAGARAAGRLGPDDPDVSSTAQRRAWVHDDWRSADGQSVGAAAAGARPGTHHSDAARDPRQDRGPTRRDGRRLRQRRADGRAATGLDADDLRRWAKLRPRDDAADASNEDRIARLLRRHRYADDRRARHHVERHLRAHQGRHHLRELRP